MACCQALASVLPRTVVIIIGIIILIISGRLRSEPNHVSPATADYRGQESPELASRRLGARAHWAWWYVSRPSELFLERDCSGDWAFA